MSARRFIVLVFLLTACERDSSAEARMFLDRLDQLDLDDPIDDRQRMVTSIRNMPLADPDIIHARDICVDAHGSMIEAEELTERVRAVLAQYPDEEQIPATRRARIESDLAHSNQKIAHARPLFERCNRERHDLERRYRSGH